MATYVYKSTNLNAPRYSGTAGDLVNLLDQCLVNGYTTGITWNGAGQLTQTGNVATFIASAAHGFDVGDWIRVAGANETDYNVTAKVITVVNTTTFTYAISNNPASPATTGTTITAYRAAAGFTINQTGTNLRTYKAGSGLQHVMAIDDTGTTTARIRIGEAASAAGVTAANLTNPTPSELQFAGGLYVVKSTVADTTARPWILVTNGKTIHFGSLAAGTQTTGTGFQFGEFKTLVAGTDVWYSFISANPTSSTAPSGWLTGLCQISMFLNTTLTVAASATYILRSYTQVGTSTLAGKIISGHLLNATNSTYPVSPGYYSDTSNVVGHQYPALAEGGMITSPFWIIEQSLVRGKIPGIWVPCHGDAGGIFNGLFSTFDVFLGSGVEHTGRTFVLWRNGPSDSLLLETSDTWDT